MELDHVGMFISWLSIPESKIRGIFFSPPKHRVSCYNSSHFANVSETPSHPGNYSIICQYMSIYFTFVSQSPNMSMSDHRGFTDSPTKIYQTMRFLHHITLHKHASHRVFNPNRPRSCNGPPSYAENVPLAISAEADTLALMPCTVCTDFYTSCV